jgi:type I restriction enzyme M protein
MTNPQAIVQKLWNYCNILRDDGLSYGDYVEQLTFLLFLKMSDERAKLYKEKSVIPKAYGWQSLVKLDGQKLDDHYRRTLENLGKGKDERLRLIFSKAQNRIQDPSKLRRLIVDLIDQEEWLSLNTDVKGDAYEGLLQKNAEDTKGGAGQYFTPRPLIDAIVEVIRPKPVETICDPACGTGGFLLSTHKFVTDRKRYKLSAQQKKKFDNENLYGVELVDSVARLCLMNMVLHGIGGGTNVNVERKDSLQDKPSRRFDVVLTNPPFGKKSTVTIVNQKGKQTKESLTIERKDFWKSSSNKQLNFIQHIYTLLKDTGRAAVIVPDNVLFEGGVGETVRRNLLQMCELHTLLRLPPGIFYAQGVKANVLFFDRKPARPKPWTEKLWIYDFRTNQNFTLKTRPLKLEDLQDFIECYNPKSRHNRKPSYSENNPQGRWRDYSYEELLKRDKANLDIFWLKDESTKDDLEEPDVIARRIFTDLQRAMDTFGLVAQDIEAR